MKNLLLFITLFSITIHISAKGHKVFFQKKAKDDTIYLKKKPYLVAGQDGDSHYLTTTEGFVITEIRNNGAGNKLVVFPILNQYIYSSGKGSEADIAKKFLLDHYILDSKNKKTGIDMATMELLYRHMLVKTGNILSEHDDGKELLVSVQYLTKYQDSGAIINDSTIVGYFDKRAHFDYKHDLLAGARVLKPYSTAHTFYFIYNTQGKPVAEVWLKFGNKGDDVIVYTKPDNMQFTFRDITAPEQALKIAVKLLILQERINTEK